MIYGCTGHRPHKLGGFGQPAYERLIALAQNVLMDATPKPTGCVSGMAVGWDQAFAHAAICLGIPLVSAVPFEKQERLWSDWHQHEYRSLLRAAKHVEIVSPGQRADWKYQKRNEWLVDHCDHVIALWDGSASGTRNCVEYALNKGVPVTNLYQEWKSMVAHG